MRIPRLLFDPDLWRALAEKRGEEVASFTLADAVITIAPSYANPTDVQQSVDEVLKAATGGRFAIRLVLDQCEDSYRIGGRRYALAIA